MKGRGFLNSFALKMPKLKFKKLNIAEILFLFVLFSFVIGYIIGVIISANTEGALFNISKNMLQQSITNKSTFGFIKYSIKSFLSFLPYILCAYFAGTSAFGCVIIPIICVTRGVFNGILISYIYSAYNLAGVGYAAFILAPYFVFSAFILVLACRESLSYSEIMLKNTLPKGTSINFFNNYKLYTIRYLIMILLCILAALLDATLTNLFFGYFNF